MEKKMSDPLFIHEKIVVEGTYGDKEVQISRCLPVHATGVDIVVLHGVHSSANLTPRNKFRFLAELLTEKGFMVWLVETSRGTREHLEGESVENWAVRAFNGKTFAQEQEDALRALKEILRRNGGKAIWLWGFSLGGIIAVSAAGLISLPGGAPAVDKLIISGTGLRVSLETERDTLKMPILSTLMETLTPDIFKRVGANSVMSFRGEFDEIFSLRSALDFIDSIGLPADKKTFFTIKGADHSFRHKKGRPDTAIIEEMVSHISGE